MLSNDKILSETINFLRFPLIVGVVFIHTILTGVNIGQSVLVKQGDFPLHDILQHLISNEFASIAVPLLYFISGFLFFAHNNFSYLTYRNKIKKRIHSLLIPYLFWNIAVFGLFFLTQTCLSSMTSGINKLIVNYTLSDWLGIFWNHRDGMPICYQFWFIRDLMVVVLCSPIIYLFVRYFKLIGIITLGLFWCLGMSLHITGFSSAAFFFFSFGAWFAINQHNFISAFKPLRLPFTFLYTLIIIVATFLWYKQIEGLVFIRHMGIAIGLIMVVTWTAHAIQNNILKCNASLSQSSFFIYAFHSMPLAIVVKLWIKFIQPTTELTMILGYILIPLFIVGLGFSIFIMMQKYLPRFTSIITGGR